jgi:hypothetical protein
MEVPMGATAAQTQHFLRAANSISHLKLVISNSFLIEPVIQALHSVDVLPQLEHLEISNATTRRFVVEMEAHRSRIVRAPSGDVGVESTWHHGRGYDLAVVKEDPVGDDEGIVTLDNVGSRIIYIYSKRLQSS